MKNLLKLFILCLISCNTNQINSSSPTLNDSTSAHDQIQANDIYYSVTPLQQPKGNDCWITSLTMLKRWKQNNPNLTIQEVLNVLGDPYSIYFQTNSGLPGTDLLAFYQKAGVAYDQPQNYTIDGWISLLKSHGPAIVDVLSFIDPIKRIVWTHARVIVGIEKKATDLESKIILIDPAVGTEVSQTFKEFLEKYEAEPANQLDHIQVAYLK